MCRDRVGRDHSARYEREIDWRLQRPIRALAHNFRPIAHTRPVRRRLIAVREPVVQTGVQVATRICAVVTDIRGLIRMMPIMTARASNHSLDRADPQRRRLDQRRHDEDQLEGCATHATEHSWRRATVQHRPTARASPQFK